MKKQASTTEIPVEKAPRMIEEAIRKINERVQAGFDEIKRLATEDCQPSMICKDDNKLHFNCECSDVRCHKRIIMKQSEYQEIHKRRDNFIMVCGHEITEMERIVQKLPTYNVIQKLTTPTGLCKLVHRQHTKR